MFETIRRSLQGNGYTPSVVLDIGCYQGYWTRDILSIYPNAKCFLFDATDYNLTNVLPPSENIKFNKAVLNDCVTTVDWYDIQGSGDSIFKENSFHYENIPPVKRETNILNNYFKIMDNNEIYSENNVKMENILMKIDCQGAEIPILKGASNLYDKIDFIILELPFFGEYNSNVPTFLEHIQFMDSIGFNVYECMDPHIVRNFNFQVDIMFINKKHRFNEIVKKVHYIR